jgi:glycosyltransferase involved in cell wall biosynthesis
MAHDETPWYFLETSESLKHAHSILANTEAEKKFIQRTKPEISSKIQVAGIGLEDQRNGSYELKLATENAFNLLYLGRIGKGKAIHELLRYFLRECLNKRVILHLAGPVEDGFELPQKNSSVLYHGRVDEAQKQELIKEADCIVNPSHHESMSILVLEAIAAGKPVLAQAECEVFQEYANDYDTVYLFSDTKSFWNQLSTMRADQPNLELRLSANSKKLRSKYQWSNIEQLIISSLYEAQGGLNTQDERRSR